MKSDLSVNDIVEIFSVTRVTVYNWLGTCYNGSYPDGKFPNAYKSPDKGVIFIPYKDVVKFINKTNPYPKIK